VSGGGKTQSGLHVGQLEDIRSEAEPLVNWQLHKAILPLDVVRFADGTIHLDALLVVSHVDAVAKQVSRGNCAPGVNHCR